MLQHIRANLLLLALTLILCSVVYPAILWAVGQTVFHDKAEGSMVVVDGKVRGSTLIAQPFTGKEYFQPRPSAAGSNGYDASASGASNYAASNPLLRDRVARQLGPIVRNDKGELVGPDVEAWFAAKVKDHPDYALLWAKDHPKLAEQWVKDNADIVAGLLKKDVKDVTDNAADNAVPFFEAYVKVDAYKGTWPTTGEKKDGDKTEKVIEPVTKGDAIQGYFFDLWLRRIPQGRAVLEKVPVDYVTTSGSGLDPHITLENARYQLLRKDGIADQCDGRAATGLPRREGHRGDPAVARRKEVFADVRSVRRAAGQRAGGEPRAVSAAWRH